MFKFKNGMDEVIQLEVHAAKYFEGGQLGIVLVEALEGYDYAVLSRNIPEAHGLLAPHQTLIPEGHEEDEMLVQHLIDQGVLIPTSTRFPYNFYTMRVFDVCLEKVDQIV